MKIYDITNNLSKSNIKPALANIFVKHTDTGIIYIATDSFRLTEVQLDNENIKDLLREGFYSPQQWKLLAKATKGKVIDYKTIKDIGLSINHLSEEIYPNYEMIMPKELIEVNQTVKQFDHEYIYQYMSFISVFTGDRFPQLNKNIKQSSNNRMLFTELWDSKGTSKARLLLMPLNN